MAGLRAVERTLRRRSEAFMPDTCTITRPAGATFDPNTGSHTPATGTTIYQGSCRVGRTGGTAIDDTVGDLHETLGRRIVDLPATEADVAVDDVVVVSASDGDSALVGRPLVVTHVEVSSWNPARRLMVEDRQQT